LCILCTESRDAIEAAFHALGDKASAWFAGERIPESERSLCCSVDVRYTGQGHELNIPCTWEGDVSRWIDQIHAAFTRQHAQVYGYSVAGAPMEITTFRAVAVAMTEKAPLCTHPMASTPVHAAQVDRRAVYLVEAGGWINCPIYDRDLLGPAHTLVGPAVIEQMDCTTLILPAQRVTVDAYLNLIIQG